MSGLEQQQPQQQQQQQQQQLYYMAEQPQSDMQSAQPEEVSAAMPAATTTYTTTSPYTVGGAAQYAGLQYAQQPQYQYAYDAQGQLVMVPAYDTSSYNSQYTQNADGTWSLTPTQAVQYMTEDGQIVSEEEVIAAQSAEAHADQPAATTTTAASTAAQAQAQAQAQHQAQQAYSIPTIQSMTIPAYQQYPYGYPSYGIAAGGAAAYPGATTEAPPRESKKSKNSCKCWWAIFHNVKWSSYHIFAIIIYLNDVFFLFLPTIVSYLVGTI